MDDATWKNENEANVAVLDGIRVLRLGKSPSGDFLARILADAGATVHGLGDRYPGQAWQVVVNDLGRGSRPPEGLDFASMAAADPDLVYCSLVSFPENGPQGLPELEDDPILAVMGLNRIGGKAPDPEPLRIPSLYGAQMAAIYIVCGLMPRNRRGTALHIEVPLFSVALNILGRKLIAFENPRLRDPQDVNFMLPVSSIRKCADGRYVQPQGRYPNLVRTLFRAAGRPEWADEAAEGLEFLPDSETYDMWDRRMDEMFLARPAAEWERLINEAGGACTMCRSHEEWTTVEQPYRSGMFRPAAGGGFEVGPGFVVHDGPPVAGAAGAQAAAGGGGDRAAAARLLDGVRVLDFTIIIAGPATGRVLADLGAEVVKIDAPDRVVNPVLWMDVNRGKRSLVLDLRKPEAREVAGRLAERADAIVENFRMGKMEAFGLGHEDVARENPGIVYASSNLFDRVGPWAGRPGWDHNAQAATGMHLARARDGEPRHMPLPVNDYGTGLFGALGVVLGLLHRDRTGRGARVAVSLARTSTFLQQMYLVKAHAISPPAVRATSIACRDGWVTAYAGQEAAVSHELLVRSAELSATEVCEELAAAGVPAVAEATVAQMVASPLLDKAGLRVRWSHPEFGPLHEVAPAGRVSGFDLRPMRCAPSPGADNTAILEEIGLGGQAADYDARGIVGSFPLFGQRRWADGFGQG